MLSNITLNEDEKDCLQELMNISYGSATAAIAEIIERFATLNIPKIKTATSPEFEEYLHTKFNKKSKYYMSNQLINGHLAGENMFIMDENSIYNLSKEFGLEDDEIDEDELKDVMLEISNIISTTTISKLSALINSSVVFCPPNIKILESLDNLEDRYKTEYQHIIIIATDLEFKDQNIHGELILLSKDESILYLKDALNKLLDEY